MPIQEFCPRQHTSLKKESCPYHSTSSCWLISVAAVAHLAEPKRAAVKQITFASPTLVPAFVLVLSALAGSARAQERTPAQLSPPVPAKFKELAAKNATAPCLEPPPLPGLAEYEGPMQKTVGVFARALERKSVHKPHYKPDVMLCSLDVRDKFLLFVNDFLDPVTFLSAGFDAGVDHASDRDPSFGQGTAGYAKRFGATLADRASSKFFKDFAYPSIFHE